MSSLAPAAVRLTDRPGPAAASRILRQHVPLLVLMGAYMAAGYATQWWLGLPNRMANIWFETTFLVYPSLALFSLPFAFAAHRWAVRDAEGRWIRGAAGWRMAAVGQGTAFLTPDRVAGITVAVLLIPLFLNTYGSWKEMIPDLQPYRLDPALAHLDRALHLGRYPWQLLQPVLGHPLVTRVVDVLYILWLPINAGIIVWQGWNPRAELRRRFFVSYILVYVLLGTAAAIALSAAGPCYYAAITGLASPYAPQMEYLHTLDAAQPLFAVRVQHTLWQNYATGSSMPFVGISAMPSVHVSVAVLFALLGWRTARWLGIALTGYAVVVILGSVHLGWHYAVDGYAGGAATLVIWWAAGRVRSGRTRTSPMAGR